MRKMWIGSLRVGDVFKFGRGSIAYSVTRFSNNGRTIWYEHAKDPYREFEFDVPRDCDVMRLV